MIPKLWLAGGAVVVVVAAVSYHAVTVSSLKATIANERTSHAQERAEAFAAAASATEAQLAEAERRRLATQGILDEERTKTASIEAALASARAAGVSLRNAAAIAARRCSAPASPSDAASSPAAEGPGVVFADVLGRLEARATDLAELADRRGLAGETCERERDALTTR